MSDFPANLSQADDSSPEKSQGPVPDSSTVEVVAELIAACQRNEREAQRELFEKFQLRVLRLATRMVGENNAADLMQQIFLQVFAKIGQFAGNSQFGTWLYRVAVNECLQHQRRQKPRATQPLQHEPAEHRLAHTEQLEQQELMDVALNRLEPDLRVIFLLREVEGQNYAELAETLELSEGTVASRLNRARKQLKQHLVDLGWEA